MTRVWLSEWEWACCGEPFQVGDDVDFGIETRMPSPALREMLGDDLAATVDAVESHHEEEFPDRVRGRVDAVHAVTHELVERRTMRRPGHGAPPDATMPADGEAWPGVRRDLGNGVFVGTQPSRYMIATVPVPDSARSEPVLGVRLPESRRDEPHPPVVGVDADPPVERRRRSLSGWIVDVDQR